MYYPCGFMDGASKCTRAGAGYCIFINETHRLEFSLGVGHGTNTKAELLSLWALLLSSQMMGSLSPMSPHQNSCIGVGRQKIFWSPFMICLSPTSIESTISWLTVSLKLRSLFLRALAILRNLLRTIWLLRILFSFTETDYVMLSTLYQIMVSLREFFWIVDSAPADAR